MTAKNGVEVLLLGDLDLAHPLRAAGADVTLVGGTDCPARFSRHRFRWLRDPRPDDDALVRLLVERGAAAGTAPLFYQDDPALLLVSRRREELSEGTCAVLPEAELVEQLVDKQRFHSLAAELGLPVPKTLVARSADVVARDAMAYPLIVKPRTRDSEWIHRTGGAKAQVVRDRTELTRLIQGLNGLHATLLFQEVVHGPESCIESYHCYVDADGELVAEFTGKKVRTRPAARGFSTSVVTTSAPDVRAVGRAVVAALGLRGVAKLDLKRSPDGRLWLLEVNPRFNLWHHVGARAGVNIPALVLADLTGRPRPRPAQARPGVGWCHVPLDLLASREAGIGTAAWLRWYRSCGPVVAGLDITDPLPFLLGRVLPRLRAS